MHKITETYAPYAGHLSSIMYIDIIIIMIIFPNAYLTFFDVRYLFLSLSLLFFVPSAVLAVDAVTVPEIKH